MTTATAPVTREMLETAWRVATFQPMRYAAERGIGIENGKDFNQFVRSMEDIAAQLVDEISESEYDSLERLYHGLWEHIHEALIDWAVAVESKRAER